VLEFSRSDLEFPPSANLLANLAVVDLNFFKYAYGSSSSADNLEYNESHVQYE